MAKGDSILYHGLATILVMSVIQACLGQTKEKDCIRIDAALTYRGNVYLFHGDEFVKLDDTLTEVRKRPIHEFGGLRGNIDAALVWSGNKRTYFFKADKYYSYSMLIVGPYKTSNWDETFKDGIDAAGNRDGDSYFFKDCNILYMERKKRLSETLLSEDLGLPCKVDAAFTKDDDLFIIKGNQIWRWGDDVTGPLQLVDSIKLTSWDVCPATEN